MLWKHGHLRMMTTWIKEDHNLVVLTRPKKDSPEMERMNDRLLEAPHTERETMHEWNQNEKDQKILELERSLEGFGKLAVERDRLLFELEAYKKAEQTKRDK